MDVAFFTLALPVCIADLNALVIPNIYNKILFYLSLINLAACGVASFRQILIALTILMVLFLLGSGMGDIKLLGLIFLNHNFNTVAFIAFVFSVAIVQILVVTWFSRRIPAKIPLAPSIFIGLATYLVAG